MFRLDDCTWWVARNLEEALADSRQDWELEASDDEARELSDDEMDSLQYHDCDDDERLIGVMTFREALRRRIEAGLSAPELFACTER